MSHLKLHFALHTPHLTFPTALLALHTSHFTLHTALFALHTSHFTLHTSHFTLHSPHFTLLTSHCFLHTPHFTLHTTPFTPHTWHCTLHTPHFISSELFSPYPSSSLLISSLLICHLSKFLSNVFISSEHRSAFLISLKFVSSHLSCSARQKALTVREKSLAQKTIGRRKLLHTDTWDTDAFTYKSLSEILCTTKLAQSTSQYYFVLQSLHKARSSTTLYYKACTKYFPVLLCTTQLAQRTSQYYFVLQSLHKLFPSTTFDYKACTNHFPALLCTTQSLHPVLLCTTELAQSTSQYYFVLQTLHKVRPSTTLCC